MLEVIKFSGEWCKPCLALHPLFLKVAEEYKDNPDIVFKEIDVDEDSENLCSYYGVRSLPTLIFSRRGMALYVRVGNIGITELRDLVERFKNEEG